jgi:LmbE family N-acetylglucosaminyl deacetylase
VRVLVIAAHPDDEVLGCGATMARFAREGHEVHVAILGEGITSRSQHREEADPSLLDALRARSGEAAKLLGAQEPRLYSLPDNRFDTVALLDVVKLIEEVVDQVAPDAIYTHHPGDLNIDHRVVHQAVLAATRPVAGCPVKEVYACEIPSATEWSFGQFAAFVPNVFVEVSTTLELKIRAMALYESEARAFPHPRSPEALRANALRWGSAAGLGSAEAFQLIRSVR